MSSSGEHDGAVNMIGVPMRRYPKSSTSSDKFTFLSELADMFDLEGKGRVVNRSHGRTQASDAKALTRDWEAVGRDIWWAVDRLKP